MEFIIHYLLKIKAKTFLLIHESNDLCLAEKIVSCRLNIPIVYEKDPLFIKGIIGCSKILIGSRFHSLVSGLSQGVPTIGTGWSHKYQELFEDYEWREGLVGLNIDRQELLSIINKITDPIFAQNLSKKLRGAAKRERIKSEDMWSMVHSLISTIRSGNNTINNKAQVNYHAP